MKNVAYFFLLFLSAGLLMNCQKIAPLTPSNPVVGHWRALGYNGYHLPAWYVAERKLNYKIVSGDTLYYGGIPGVTGIHSFTLAEDKSMSEAYVVQDPFSKQSEGKSDRGSWTVTDTVVHLSVVNGLPRDLTYRYASDQLISDKVAQTYLYWRNGNPNDTIRISYTLQLFYERGDP